MTRYQYIFSQDKGKYSPPPPPPRGHPAGRHPLAHSPVWGSGVDFFDGTLR